MGVTTHQIDPAAIAARGAVLLPGPKRALKQALAQSDDTAVADFNYAQIFSENSFSGGDRINDANQLTVALTSRVLTSSTGQELFRATLGQRYYFKDQSPIGRKVSWKLFNGKWSPPAEVVD